MVRGRGWCGAGGTGGQRLGIRGTGLGLEGSANGRRRARVSGAAQGLYLFGGNRANQALIGWRNGMPQITERPLQDYDFS